MMIKTMKRSLISVFRNLPGKSVGRKIVVIECDDWGGRGVPSAGVYQKLKAAGLPMDESRYSRYDTLASAEDLDALFEVLMRHKAANAGSAIMSPFCNTANPDYEKIRQSGFLEYFREPLLDTLKNHPKGDVQIYWKQGIDAGIWMPEYHGREHLATALWLKALRSGDPKLMIAFEHGFASYSPPGTPVAALNFRPNFYVEDSAGLPGLRNDMEEGIELFREAVGFYPEVFNAPNGVFVEGFDEYLVKKKIMFNAVPRQRLDMGVDGTYRYRTFKTGERADSGMTYYVRNCNFEPTQKGYSESHVLSQIGGAFTCGKAAIICTHRVNFVGGISKANREVGLNALDKLLQSIVKRWPEVEFMSSRQFTHELVK